MMQCMDHQELKLQTQLQEVVALISAYLNTDPPPTPSQRALLDEDIDYFLNHIQPISTALSKHLSTTLATLTNIQAQGPLLLFLPRPTTETRTPQTY